MPSSFSVLLFFLCACTFLGFGLYSIWFLYARWKNPTRNLKRFDSYARSFVLTAGIVYAALWLSELILYWFSAKPEIRVSYEKLLAGPEGFWFWLPPVYYLLVTQLLWVEKLRNWTLTRLIIGLLLIVGFSGWVRLSGLSIPDTSIGWTLKPEYKASAYLLADLLLKPLVFLGMLLPVYLLRNKKSTSS